MDLTPTVIVAAAVVIEHNQVLLTQRKKGSHLEGAWEFPGGKVEASENPEDALVRELDEEVGVTIKVKDILDVTFHAYGEKCVLLLFYEAERVPGSKAPVAIDVADVKWASLTDLRDELFPEADIRVLKKVRARLSQ